MNIQSSFTTVKILNCLVCGSSKTHSFRPRKTHRMIVCRECGFFFEYPLVDKEEYQKRIKRHFSKIDPQEEVGKSRRLIYERFLNKKEIIKRKGRLLDIGCGYGVFLAQAKAHGWSVSGVELSEDLAQKGFDRYQIKIVAGAIEDLDMQQQKFDVITMWNVFDELVDPSLALQRIKDLLKDNGLVFIRIPNGSFHYFCYRCFAFLKSIGFPNVVVKTKPIFHIFNFSSKSIKRLLEKQDFKNVRIFNARLTSGDPYSTKKRIRLLKGIVYAFSQTIFFLSLGTLKTSPSLEVFAQK